MPALVMALAQPVWSRVDEAQHTDFIIQLSHGVYPLADRTIIDPETLRVMQSSGVFRFESPGTYPIPNLTDIGPPPAGMSPRANAVWMSRHIWQLSYESAQPPGYYVLMVPAWSVADRIGGTLAGVYVMRIINALLIALLTPMALVVAWRLAPGRLDVAALSALFAALLPGLALNGTRVGNDALAAVLGGLVIVLAARSVGHTWTWRRAALVGLTLGAGLLVKLTLIGLLPAVALAVLWPVSGSSWPLRIARAAVAAAVAGACLVPWFLVNEHSYGALSPFELTSRLTQALPMPLTPALLGLDVAFFLLTYWAGEPLGALPFAASFAVLGGLIALIATAGLIKSARLPAINPGSLLVAIVAVAGVVGLAFLLPAASGFDYLSPGRYAYPALPASAALLSVGVWAALARASVRRALTGLYGVAAAVILVGSALGLAADESHAGAGAPSTGSDVVSVRAGGQLGSLSLEVDRVALDNADHATWLHVNVNNSGSVEAEWSPIAVVSAHGATVLADYARSTHLHGDIDGGESASGWIYVPLQIQPGQQLVVRFPDVAVDGYRIVGDVVLQFNV
jgi:4-amino-4-deoxy-L-arabinose transferase-like glycosyltransferase